MALQLLQSVWRLVRRQQADLPTHQRGDHGNSESTAVSTKIHNVATIGQLLRDVLDLANEVDGADALSGTVRNRIAGIVMADGRYCRHALSGRTPAGGIRTCSWPEAPWQSMHVKNAGSAVAAMHIRQDTSPPPKANSIAN